jgi:hypothetical protein
VFLKNCSILGVLYKCEPNETGGEEDWESELLTLKWTDDEQALQAKGETGPATNKHRVEEPSEGQAARKKGPIIAID